MSVRLFVSSTTASNDMRYKQTQILGFLAAKGVEFETVDISDPSHSDDRKFMRVNAKAPQGKTPLPPQVFFDDDYCGDYEAFFEALESENLYSFLKLPVPEEEAIFHREPEEEKKDEEKTEEEAEKAEKKKKKKKVKKEKEGSGSEDEDESEEESSEEEEDESEEEDEEGGEKEKGSDKEDKEEDKKESDEEEGSDAESEAEKEEEDKTKVETSEKEESEEEGGGSETEEGKKTTKKDEKTSEAESEEESEEESSEEEKEKLVNGNNEDEESSSEEDTSSEEEDSSEEESEEDSDDDAEEEVLSYTAGNHDFILRNMDINRLQGEQRCTNQLLDFALSYIWKECLFARIRKKTHVFQLDDTHEMVTITKKLGGGGVHDYRDHEVFGNIIHTLNQRQVQLKDMRWLVFPINYQKHYTLLIADMKRKARRATIYYLDSLELVNSLHVWSVQSFIKSAEELTEFVGYKKFNLEAPDASARKIPKQPDFKSCGFYVMMYMKKFFENRMDGKKPNFEDWFTDNDVLGLKTWFTQVTNNLKNNTTLKNRINGH